MQDSPLIERRSLATELVERLRGLIQEGQLRPGDKIVEPELCERFGVSRTPLREALKVLAAEGLVDLSPNRGARVARISPEAVEELFPIMGMLEALAGELCIQRMAAADLALLEALHVRMVAHWRAGEWAPYGRLNRQVHEEIFRIAGNGALAALYQSLLIRTHAIRFMARKTPERWAEAVDDHERIMAALRARDASGLNLIMREHLRHKADVVHEALKQLDAG